MIRHDEVTATPATASLPADGADASGEAFELRYCFLCDADAPHLSVEVEGLYLFQCSACFAGHTEPLPGTASAHGRHRMAA